MTVDQRKESFIQLGKFLGQFRPEGIQKQDGIVLNDSFFDRLKGKVETAQHHNGWFTSENVLFSLYQWSQALSKENLDRWLEPYQLHPETPKKVGIIMAGNIPLVGFHDFLSVLISGHRLQVKQSSNDQLFLPVLADYLMATNPLWKDFIEFAGDGAGDGRMKEVDAMIATGSNNTARYFEYYFAHIPTIIRKNRNSVAVLTGEESQQQLEALGEDIFRYFGLGCRSVSKLYVPHNYDFDPFFKAIYSWADIINQEKYANNYDYNKAVYLMSQFKLLENGFLMLKEDRSFGSPIATLFYEHYQDINQLKRSLQDQKESIQCVVSQGIFTEEVPFGKTQFPRLWDYADGVDTLSFLSKL